MRCASCWSLTLSDVVFNFFSIVFPFIGQLIRFKYLDAIGGALLSICASRAVVCLTHADIIYEWAETLFENVSNLSGARASPAEHQRIAYLLSRFSPLIKGVQFLNVYTQGDRVIVETDIVLPHDTPLPVAQCVRRRVLLTLQRRRRERPARMRVPEWRRTSSRKSTRINRLLMPAGPRRREHGVSLVPHGQSLVLADYADAGRISRLPVHL